MSNFNPNRTLFHRPIASCLMLLVSTSVLARGFDDVIEEHLEDLSSQINQRIEGQIETRVDRQVKAKVRQSVEETIEDSISEKLNQDIADVTDTITEAPAPREENIAPEIEVVATPQARLRNVESVVDGLIDSRIEAITEQIDIALDTVNDARGNTALSEEWLVLSDEAALKALEAEGYLVSKVEHLSGLGYLLSTVRAPATFDPSQNIASVEVITNHQLVMDMNHVYLPQRDESVSIDTAIQKTSRRTSSGHSRIGMIDSSIDKRHSVFRGANIAEQSFTPRNMSTTNSHGTAIASILIGESDLFQGVSPESDLYNGVVFAMDEKGREFSTTAAIVRAINWLVEQDVRLINMSLAGPDNAILKRAIASACDKGTTLITAVGNAGPASPPLYPAAYDCTIAVTAVDSDHQAYHRASRGDHVDFALYGVNISHAANSGYQVSSGTSYAAALLTGTLASLMPEFTMNSGDIKQRLQLLAEDLGSEGNDPVYGYGLIRSQTTALLSK